MIWSGSENNLGALKMNVKICLYQIVNFSNIVIDIEQFPIVYI